MLTDEQRTELDGYFHVWDRVTDEVLPLTLYQFEHLETLYPYTPTNSYDERMRVAIFKTDDVKVSTMFLGQNVGRMTGTPLFFETMVFGGPLDEECERYRTAEEARKGHAAMVERVLAAIEQMTVK